MAKELLFYSPIHDDSVRVAVEQLQAIDINEDVKVRLNTPGGGVEAGFTFLSVISERKGKVNAIIDGQAKSMGAYWLPFFDNVEANDTSSITFHKAAFPPQYKPTVEQQAYLDNKNAMFEIKMRAKVEGKPGADEFLNKLFAKDVRNDVDLTPYQAKELGIVNKVRPLTPKAYSEIQIVAMVEEGFDINTEVKAEDSTASSNKSDNQKQINMTKEEIKAAHPEVYAEIIAEERERAEAYLVFLDVDPEGVKAGIASQKPLSAKAMAEFALKATSGAHLDNHKKDNIEDISATDTTQVDAKTAEQLELEADMKAIDEEFGTTKAV